MEYKELVSTMRGMHTSICNRAAYVIEAQGLEIKRLTKERDQLKAAIQNWHECGEA